MLVILLNFGVHVSEVTCTMQLPVAGMKCLFYPVPEEEPSDFMLRKAQSMPSLIHAVGTEFQITAQLLGIVWVSLENASPLYLSSSISTITKDQGTGLTLHPGLYCLFSLEVKEKIPQMVLGWGWPVVLC